MRIRLFISAAAFVVAAPLLLAAQTPATPALQPTGTSAQAVPLDRVVAVVGDVIVTQSNLQERIIQKRQDGIQLPTDSTMFHTFVLSVVNELVDEELILQKAKDLKIEVPDAEGKFAWKQKE